MTQIAFRPEYPTLAERFVTFFRLPYVIGCGLIALVSSGAPFMLAISGSLRPFGAVDSVVFILLVTVTLYAPRYMRARLLEAELSLSSLLPNTETDFHRLFGSVSSTKLQLLVMALFFPAVLVSNLETIGTFANSPLVFLATIAGAVVLTLGFGSTVCAYFVSLWGIHRMGSTQMELRPYFEDLSLGLRPVGALAFSLAKAYFAIAGLGLIGAVATTFSLSAYALVLAVIILGVILFFLPLFRLHRRMLQQKMIEKDKLSKEVARVFRATSETDSPGELTRLFKLDMMERKVSSMPVWPFNMQILGRFSIIVLSVTAVLLSRIIAAYLKIVIPLG